MNYRHTILFKALFFFFYLGAFADLDTDLLNASRRNDIEAVRALLESGANPNAYDGQILTFAAYDRHPEIIQLLLEFGADPHVQNDLTFIVAARERLIETVRLLLALGVDANTQNGIALYEACVYGYIEIVELLLNAEADPNIDKGMAFRMACNNGHLEIVKLLLQKGADPNAEDGKALSQACSSGNLEIVMLLLDAGVDLNAGEGMALSTACAKGHLEIVKLLLQKGADPNAEDGKALSQACSFGNLEIVMLLLDAGVDPNAGEGMGLSAACASGHLEIVKLLLQKGADPNAKDGEALIKAYENNRIEVAKFLIKLGVKLNADQMEKTLINAFNRGYIEAIGFLCQNGAKINNAQNREKILIKVCSKGNIKILKLLLETLEGISPRKKAALIQVCMRGHGDIAKFLLAADMESDMRWLSARPLSYPEVLQLLAGSVEGALKAIEQIALKHIQSNDFDSFIEIVSSSGSKLAENQTLLQEILLSGNYDFVKYAFENVPNLRNTYLIGLSNYSGGFTAGIKNILNAYIKMKENGYLVQISLPIVSDVEIISHFSGLINPGAGDTYPKHEEPFSLKDMDAERMLIEEKVYQQMVAAAKEYDIPYLGICAGAQHLILNSEGSLQRKGHKSRAEVRVFSGTIPHYLFLTESERANALASCELPEIVINTPFFAHAYSGVPELLGEDIHLGGISSEEIPVLFSLGANKIGVQFHPEHYHPDHFEYKHKKDVPELNRQEIFLENVFGIFEGYYASMQYAKKVGLEASETKAALAHANRKLFEKLQSCQSWKASDPEELLWSGTGSLDIQEIERIYTIPGVTPEHFAYSKAQNDLILYSNSKNGVVSARDFFAGNGTKSTVIHFADGSTFYLQNKNETTFEEGKSHCLK